MINDILSMISEVDKSIWECMSSDDIIDMFKVVYPEVSFERVPSMYMTLTLEDGVNEKRIFKDIHNVTGMDHNAVETFVKCVLLVMFHEYSGWNVVGKDIVLQKLYGFIDDYCSRLNNLTSMSS